MFHALRKRKYAGAEKLNPRDHVHKSALYPFLNMIGNWFEKNKFFGKDPQLNFDRSLSPNEKELLQIRFKMKDPDGKLKWAQLDSPLEFNARVDDRLTNFELELTEVAAVNNAQNIWKYIKSSYSPLLATGYRTKGKA